MEAVQSDSQPRGFHVRLSPVCTAWRPLGRGGNRPRMQSALHSPGCVPWHGTASVCKTRFLDFCKMALVSWPNLHLPLSLQAKWVTLSNIHSAFLSACRTLLRASQSVASASVPSTLLPKKYLLALASLWAEHVPECGPASLGRLESLLFSPIFLGKNSRRTSEKETGLLKSRTKAGCISKIKSLLKNLLAWPSLWMEHSWAKCPVFWSLNIVTKGWVGLCDANGAGRWLRGEGMCPQRSEHGLGRHTVKGVFSLENNNSHIKLNNPAS